MADPPEASPATPLGPVRPSACLPYLSSPRFTFPLPSLCPSQPPALAEFGLHKLTILGHNWRLDVAFVGLCTPSVPEAGLVFPSSKMACPAAASEWSL